MKILRLAFAYTFVLLGLIFPGTAAEAARGGRVHYSTLFNPATVTTVAGEVVRLEQVISGNGADYCIQALLSTPQGPLTAILAPKSYMTKQKLTLAPGDRVTVKGSRITIANKPYLLVTQMSGDRTMTLRRPDGRPLWAVGADWHVRPSTGR